MRRRYADNDMSDEPDFPTELDQLAFLLEEVPRALRRRFDERMLVFGLSRTQWRILAYLLRDEGMTQTELAQCLELERVTVGLTLNKMEEKGLIERRRAHGDRRSWRVYAMPTAKTLVPALRREADQIYAELLAGLSRHRLNEFRSVLEALALNLRELGFRSTGLTGGP